MIITVTLNPTPTHAKRMISAAKLLCLLKANLAAII
jgi:hypothetical protein